MRKGVSGALSTALTAFLQAPGKAARTSPSITRTRPMAARRSRIRANRQRAGTAACGAGAGAAGTAGATGAGEDPFGFAK